MMTRYPAKDSTIFTVTYFKNRASASRLPASRS